MKALLQRLLNMTVEQSALQDMDSEIFDDYIRLSVDKKSIQALRVALTELEELELFKSEHLRLEAELNAILHPNGDGPTAPSFCDLVAYVRAELEPKTCNTCSFDHCGCSVQDDILRYDPNATFEVFGCTAHELSTVPTDDMTRIHQLEQMLKAISAELLMLRRKHQIGIHCCHDAENSNGWSHSGKCKNWVLVY
jgi:hypothetical protein